MDQEAFAFTPRKSGYLRPGQLGFKGGETSRGAAVKVAEGAAVWRERVFERIRNKGRDGCTADELVSFFGTMHNTVAPRVSELSNAGRIVKSGRRRETRAGVKAVVWVVR